MKKSYGECADCKYYDATSEKSWCRNRKGAYFGRINFHIGDCGCSHFIAWKKPEPDLEVPKKLADSDFTRNPWMEWKEKQMKGLIHD